MVMLLGSMWGLSGVWWSLTISSILKGVILTVWFIIYLKKKLGNTSFQN